MENGIKLDKVLNGLVKYVNRTILPTMNDWQKIGTRVILARVLRLEDGIHKFMQENTFIRTFGVISPEGDVDVDGLIRDIKSLFEQTPIVELNIPLYGKIKLEAADIDELQKCIVED